MALQRERVWAAIDSSTRNRHVTRRLECGHALPVRDASCHRFRYGRIRIDAAVAGRDPAPHVKYVFGGLRFMARTFPNLLKATVRTSLLRELALAVPVSVGSRRMPVNDALRAVEDLAASSAFEETFDNTRAPFSGRDIAIPVTVAFGDRDWILPKGSQRRNDLPEHTRWIKKHGWGHVPMWVDPLGVAQLILEGTQ